MIVKNAHRTKRTHHHNYTEQNAPQLHSPPVAPTTMELLHLRDKDWKQAKAYLVQTGREYYPPKSKLKPTKQPLKILFKSVQMLFMIFCYTDAQTDRRMEGLTHKLNTNPCMGAVFSTSHKTAWASKFLLYIDFKNRLFLGPWIWYTFNKKVCYLSFRLIGRLLNNWITAQCACLLRVSNNKKTSIVLNVAYLKLYWHNFSPPVSLSTTPLSSWKEYHKTFFPETDG